MRFIGTQKNLLDGVSAVSALAGRNPQLPILQNVLMEVRDGVLNLTCTDLEVGAHVTVVGKAEKDGSGAVPARQLLEYIQQLPGLEPVVLELKKTGLMVSTKNFSAQFPVMAVEDFPILPVPQDKERVLVDSRLFCQSISNTLFAAAKDETRPEIHSVMVSGGEDEIRVVATDSFRLAEQVLPWSKKDKGFSFLLPVNAAQETVRLFGGKDELGLLIEQNYIAFQSEGCNLSARLIDGTYPNYQQIIPTKFSSNCVVDVDEFLRALKVLSVFIPRESRRVSLKVKPEKEVINIKVEGGESGSGEVDVGIEGTGKEVDVLFNIQYLLEGFQHMTSDRCEMSFGGASDPLLIKPHASSVKQLYVIMPIQA